ncbi:MAG: 2-iminobutanoate/2-iminopropanoate deaminase [Gaiellales bacterium]|nr:2-iminobutanoate/2-iminopropanoate deaminase [Gaiellales bacterium]
MSTSRHIVVGRGSTMGAGEAEITDDVRYGDLLILSGRAAVDPATLAVLDAGFAAQAQRVLADIDAVLEAGGSSRSQVLRVECFLADASDFPAWNGIWCEHFAPPRPARTTVVCGFAVPGILIELQVTAGIGGVEA